MIEKFNKWYKDNYFQTTWFLIGFLAYDFFDGLAKHDYSRSLLSAVLIGTNYYFVRKDAE